MSRVLPLSSWLKGLCKAPAFGVDGKCAVAACVSGGGSVGCTAAGSLLVAACAVGSATLAADGGRVREGVLDAAPAACWPPLTTDVTGVREGVALPAAWWSPLTTDCGGVREGVALPAAWWSPLTTDVGGVREGVVCALSAACLVPWTTDGSWTTDGWCIRGVGVCPAPCAGWPCAGPVAACDAAFVDGDSVPCAGVW